jgi:hypothetical protein
MSALALRRAYELAPRDHWTDREYARPMDTTLTTEQGFRAMFIFLDSYWSEFKTATLGDVLSDLQPADGGQSSDPAMWQDWLRAVEAATT